MKIPVADLTQISTRRDGQFPHDEIRNIIIEYESVHGTQAMPVWGKIFMQMEPTEHGCLNLLLTYLNSIRQKEHGRRREHETEGSLIEKSDSAPPFAGPQPAP